MGLERVRHDGAAGVHDVVPSRARRGRPREQRTADAAARRDGRRIESCGREHESLEEQVARRVERVIDEGGASGDDVAAVRRPQGGAAADLEPQRLPCRYRQSKR